MLIEDAVISIIVPVYNTEKYLKRCIESLLKQTYLNLEIILVNNGSTDNSGEICEYFKKANNHIHVIHIRHSCISKARNTGIEYATGKYIGFVDSDDWIEQNMYEVLYRAIVLHQAQLAVCGFYKNAEQYEIAMENAVPINQISESSEELLRYAFIRDRHRAYCGYVWNKLFDANTVRETKFDENIKICEDVEFFSRYALKVDKAVYADNPLYHYWQREDSISHAFDYDKRVTILQAYSKIIRLLEDSSISMQTIDFLKRFYTYHASIILVRLCQSKEYVDLKFIKKENRRYMKEYICSNRKYIFYLARYALLLICPRTAVFFKIINQ